MKLKKEKNYIDTKHQEKNPKNKRTATAAATCHAGCSDKNCTGGSCNKPAGHGGKHRCEACGCAWR